MKRLNQYLKLTGFIFTVTLLFLSKESIAQNETDTVSIYRFITADDNEYLGKILLRDSTITVIRTPMIDSLLINNKYIKSIKKIEKGQIINGRLWYENPQSARYMWAPNGYGLKKGEAYYQNIWVMFNQVSVGLTDNISIGAGLIPTFLFGGNVIPVWVTPKVSIPVVKNKINLGAGALLISVKDGETNNSASLVYGLSTFGSKDKNFTIGIGYGHSANGWAKSPAINLSGMLRTGSKGYLITENYFIDSYEGFLAICMFGGRALINQISLDYGLVVPFESDLEQFIAIPWLGITVPFGKI